jgi:hypothetical protein
VQEPGDNQLPGTPPATAPILLAGMLSTVLLCGVSHIVAFKVMAAINVQYPNSGIIRQIHVVHTCEAQQFFQQWPDALSESEGEYSQDVHLSTGFQEIGTQNAFLSISARLKNVEQVTTANQNHLAVISRRTEQFSPSKQRSSHQPPTNHLLYGSNVFLPIPQSFDHPASFPSPSLQSPRTPPLLTPQSPPSSTCEPIAHSSPMQSSPHTPSPHLTNSPKALTPFSITHPKGLTYWVLPLLPCVPGLGQTQSTRDLILPPSEAFSLPGHTYPTFHTQNCTWNSVLSLVQQAPLLWTVYAPKRLGEYADIKSLWQAWEEGMTVEGVGCTPPLRLIDERWGSRRGHRTDWRPRNNENVSFL